MSYDPRTPEALERFRKRLHQQLMDTEGMTEEQATGLVLLAIETGKKIRDMNADKSEFVPVVDPESFIGATLERREESDEEQPRDLSQKLSNNRAYPGMNGIPIEAEPPC